MSVAVDPVRGAVAEVLEARDSSASDKHRNVKCPECSLVQSATHDKCSRCGHELAGARKAKFAKTQEAAHRFRSVKARNLRTGHVVHHGGRSQAVVSADAVTGPLSGDKIRTVLDGPSGTRDFDPEERLSVASETVEAQEMTDVERAVAEAADSLRKASTPEPFSKSKTSNWVARGGGLPAYIQHIAHDLMEKRGKSESNAIQMAIGIVKRWARGGGNVDANTRAAAAKAVAEWEALKAKSKVKEAAELAVLESAWADDDPAVLAEAERYEADSDLCASLMEAATTKDKPDVDTDGDRSDGLKVKCPACNHRTVPKSGKCANCGKDVSKLAKFAKRLKGKTQEAEDRGGTEVQRAIRDGLETVLS